MENLDLVYKAFTNFKKEIEKDKETISLFNHAIKQSKEANEDLNIIYSTVEIDEEWLKAIEKGIPYIEKAIKEDRQFIRNDGEVIPIEKAKKISKATIEDLSKHSNYITHESENEDIQVMPDKIFVINKESDYSIYENKVVYATLIYLKKFISMRLNKIKEMVNTFHYESKINKHIELGNRLIDVRFSLNENRINDINATNYNSSNEIIDRLEKALINVMGLLKFPLMVEVAKSDMISRPITKTNILRMNTNFRESLALFDYISEYNGDGYKITTINKSLKPFNDELSNSLSSTFLAYSFISYIYGTGISDKLRKRLEEKEIEEKKKRENELLARLKSLSFKANQNEMTLIEYFEAFEKGYRILEDKNKELNNKLIEAEEKRILDLKSQKEQFDNKIILINEKHEDEIASLKEQRDKEINELKVSYNSQIEEINNENKENMKKTIAGYENKILKQQEDFDFKFSKNSEELQGKINNLSSELNDEKDKNASLINDNFLLKSRIITDIKAKDKNENFASYLSEEGFDELEKTKKVFDSFYNKAWKNAKKNIRKNTLKIIKKDKKDGCK